MPFAPFVTRAADRNSLIKQHVITDLSRFADHDAEAMVDKEAFPDPGAGVNLDGSHQARHSRHQPGKNKEPLAIEKVSGAMEYDCVQPLVAKENFQAALGGRVLTLDCTNMIAEPHRQYLLSLGCINHRRGCYIWRVETARLYYHDAYTSSFEAQVIDIADSGRRVYLDRTFFYPTSGGQPHDTGLLDGIAVTDVVDEGNRIAHVLSEPVTGEVVRAAVDWSRRLDHMQQHSGQHLLSAILLEGFGIGTLSFHMGPEVSTIELGAKHLTSDQIAWAEERANEIVRAALPVTISFEEADSAEALRKESKRTGTLRIIEIQSIDRSACGGTHVKTTAEIGSVQIRGSDKVRGNVRIEFVCGVRALRRSRLDFQILAQLSKQAAAPPEKLVESVSATRQRLLDAERDRDKLKVQVAHYGAEASYREAPVSPDGLHRLFVRAALLDEAVRLHAVAFAANPKAICLVAADEPLSVLVSCSLDSGLDAGALLKRILTERGGRGGGSASLAQAKLPDEQTLEAVRQALGFF